MATFLENAISSHRSNMCCPRDCVSRHNGGTSGAPLKPLRDDSALSINLASGIKNYLLRHQAPHHVAVLASQHLQSFVDEGSHRAGGGGLRAGGIENRLRDREIKFINMRLISSCSIMSTVVKIKKNGIKTLKISH